VCGGALCSGPDIEGIGRGAGAAGAELAAGVLPDVELGVACGSEEVVCPTDGNAASPTKKTARKVTDVMRKVISFSTWS